MLPHKRARQGLRVGERESATRLCGTEASVKLRELIDAGQVRCLGSGQDRHGRLIAVCLSGETNINAAMVAAGMAFAYKPPAPETVLHHRPVPTFTHEGLQPNRTSEQMANRLT